MIGARLLIGGVFHHPSSDGNWEDSMSRKVKLVACLAGAIAPWLLMMVGAAAPADEQYRATQIVNVPGGLTSFDISFVDPEINTFVLADRTNKAIDVVNTNTKALVQ